MDDHRHAGALTDDVLDRDIARALAVNPSPDFRARVRTAIATEPAPGVWRFSWAVSFAGGAVVAAAILGAVVVMRQDRSPSPRIPAPLSARAILGQPTTLPYVAAAFRRITPGPAEAGRRTRIENARTAAEFSPLFDPRESLALRSLIAGLRDNRVDLSPLLQPGAPAPMEPRPIDHLTITPITIEPIAPWDGAQGERQ